MCLSHCRNLEHWKLWEHNSFIILGFWKARQRKPDSPWSSDLQRHNSTPRMFHNCHPPDALYRMTPASFEPSIDYVVTKMPRFAFEKFPGAKAELTTMMKSVGETMAMGRTWIESFQKACRGLEIGLDGWALPKDYKLLPRDQLIFKLRVPCPERIIVMKQAFNEGMTKEELNELTKFDPWWLDNLQARSAYLVEASTMPCRSARLIIARASLPFRIGACSAASSYYSFKYPAYTPPFVHHDPGGHVLSKAHTMQRQLLPALAAVANSGVLHSTAGTARVGALAVRAEPRQPLS
jgi:hypothetical protein